MAIGFVGVTDSLPGCGRLKRVALDHRQIGIDEHAAVEAGDRPRQGERLNEHAHAARWAAARDGEGDAGGAQFTHCRLCRIGQHFVPGQQGTVYVRQEQTGAAPSFHGYWMRDTRPAFSCAAGIFKDVLGS